jgi:predicted P-loop ATPase/GTPase
MEWRPLSLELQMELKDKLVEILLNQLNFSQSDLDKVKAVLDNINVRKVGDKTFIDIRLNKITVVLESDKNEY